MTTHVSAETPDERLQRLEEMALANAMAIMQLAPVAQALAVIVPGLAALVVDRDDMPEFVKLITADADNVTKIAVAELLTLPDGQVH